jgi:hypothetical protein
MSIPKRRLRCWKDKRPASDGKTICIDTLRLVKSAKKPKPATTKKQPTKKPATTKKSNKACEGELLREYYDFILPLANGNMELWWGREEKLIKMCKKFIKKSKECKLTNVYIAKAQLFIQALETEKKNRESREKVTQASSKTTKPRKKKTTV